MDLGVGEVARRHRVVARGRSSPSEAARSGREEGRPEAAEAQQKNSKEPGGGGGNRDIGL